MKKKLFRVVCGLLFCSMSMSAQVAAVNFKLHAPAAISMEKKIYLAGSFNHWYTKDSLFEMKRVSNNLYSITIPVFAGVQYEYKYTLGSWDEEELALNDSDIQNRSFLSANGKTILDTVIKWKSPKPQPKNNNPAERFQPLKDSLASCLKSRQDSMIVLFKNYLINKLQENPNTEMNQKITNEITRHLTALYESVDRAASKILGELTVSQKEKILKAITTPGSDQDIINAFLKAYDEALEN